MTRERQPWMDFSPGEMKVIAVTAYTYNDEFDGHTQVLEKRGGKRSEDVFKTAKHFQEGSTRRKYLPYERFILAVRKLAKAMEEKGSSFEIAEFDFATNRVKANAIMDPKRIEESRKVYLDLINWNEKALSELSAKGSPYSRYCDSMGFHRSEPVPVIEEKREGSDIEAALQEMEPKEMAPENAEGPIPEKRGPGRPPKAQVPE